MSTFTDGAPPSVSPGPEEPFGPGYPAEPSAVIPSPMSPPTSPPMSPTTPSSGPDDENSWLQEEIRRRIAAKSTEGRGARHARRGTPTPSNQVGYTPRHSVPGMPAARPTEPGRPEPGRPEPEPGPAPSSIRRVARAGEAGPRPSPRPKGSEATPWPAARADPAAPDFRPEPGAPNVRPEPVDQVVRPEPAPPNLRPGPVDPPPGAPLTRPEPVAGPPRPTPRPRPHPAVVDEPAPQTPARPTPPAGEAAARLLSPPPGPAPTPTGAPLPDASRGAETGPFPAARRVGPRPTASPELEASGEVLWDSITPPVASGRGGRLLLPRQRRPPAAPPAEADTEAPTGALPVTEPADAGVSGTAPVVAVAPAVSGTAPVEAVEPEAETGSEEVQRVRVVLAERRSVARPVRSIVDVQEGTGVGEVLRSNLIRAQLTVALSFAVGAMLTLGVLPLVFAFYPEISNVTVLGIRLPWLLLGGMVYPFLLLLGWWHTRTAERVEQSFADHVQD